MEKDKRIEAEEKRLKSILSRIGTKKKKAVEGLIKEAAYMRATLDDYKKDLDENGYVEMFSQSEKTDPYERTRPVAQLYGTMNKNYQSIMKQLMDCIEEEPKKKRKDEFADFVSARDD